MIFFQANLMIKLRSHGVLDSRFSYTTVRGSNFQGHSLIIINELLFIHSHSHHRFDNFTINHINAISHYIIIIGLCNRFGAYFDAAD